MPGMKKNQPMRRHVAPLGQHCQCLGIFFPELSRTEGTIPFQKPSHENVLNLIILEFKRKLF
jgi:hypothetical protein